MNPRNSITASRARARSPPTAGPLKIAKGIAVFIPGNTEHGVEAGDAGLSILYGFARHAFRDVVYHYTPIEPAPP